jgi:DNA-damage-inducible protein D
MNRNSILEMKNKLDSLAQIISEENIEFWFARDLQEPLGYLRWENFITAIKRAIESCKSIGCTPDNHFRGVTKMVLVGSGAERQVEDFVIAELPENLNAEVVSENKALHV